MFMPMKNICNSMFANYVCFGFLHDICGCLRAFSVNGMKVGAAGGRGSLLDLSSLVE